MNFRPRRLMAFSNTPVMSRCGPILTAFQGVNAESQMAKVRVDAELGIAEPGGVVMGLDGFPGRLEGAGGDFDFRRIDGGCRRLGLEKRGPVRDQEQSEHEANRKTDYHKNPQFLK
jgi:hypothetical protein